MRQAFVIARVTFREAIRDRVFIGIFGFALAYILLTIFLGKLSLGDMVMIRSFGLAGAYLSSMVITVFLGSSVLHKEIDRRTLYFVLAKPVSRLDVVLGKFMGLFGAIAATTAFMGAVYAAVIAYQGGGLDLWGLLAIALSLVELALFTALLIMLSAVVAPLTATVCALMMLSVGHLLPDALAQAQIVGGIPKLVMQLFYFALPNLDKFDIRTFVVHSISVSAESIFVAFFYGAAYTAALLALAYLLFRRREL